MSRQRSGRNQQRRSDINSAAELEIESGSRLDRDRYKNPDFYLLADWLKENAVQLAGIRETLEQLLAAYEAHLFHEEGIERK